MVFTLGLSELGLGVLELRGTCDQPSVVEKYLEKNRLP